MSLAPIRTLPSALFGARRRPVYDPYAIRWQEVSHVSPGKEDPKSPSPDPGGEFRADCSCPKKKCERHGYCEECKAYHGRKGKQPHCLRKKDTGGRLA